MEAEVGGENVEDGEKEGKFWGGVCQYGSYEEVSTEQRKARSQER